MYEFDMESSEHYSQTFSFKKMLYYREHMMKQKCKYLACDPGVSKGQRLNKDIFSDVPFP